MERHPRFWGHAWLSVFLLAIWAPAHRPLWYDELLTFYGATSTSLDRFRTGLSHFDFNPPLQYVLVRIAVRVFGDSPLVVRLPMLLAFLAGSLLLYRWIARRYGAAFGFLAVSLFWCSGCFQYAYEARPYAVALSFGASSFVFWAELPSLGGWSKQHTALWISVAGLFLSHYFAPFFALPLFAGELVRACQTRCWNRATWIALLSPAVIVLAYLPLLGAPGRVLYPQVAIATLRTPFAFYAAVGGALLVPAGLGIAAALLLVPPKTAVVREHAIPLHEWVYIVTALIAPLLPILYCISARVSFANRYGIEIYFPATLALIFALRRLSGGMQTSAALGALLLLFYFGVRQISFPSAHSATPQPSDSAMIRPGVPIVVADGGRFMELDHNASTDIANRLYYLTDRAAAIGIAHSTMFEEFGQLPKAYPIRGHVLPYRQFIAEHRTFDLISIDIDAGVDWLLPKLREDGVVLKRSARAPWIYSVSLQRTR